MYFLYVKQAFLQQKKLDIDRTTEAKSKRNEKKNGKRIRKEQRNRDIEIQTLNLTEFDLANSSILAIGIQHSSMSPH